MKVEVFPGTPAVRAQIGHVQVPPVSLLSKMLLHFICFAGACRVLVAGCPGSSCVGCSGLGAVGGFCSCYGGCAGWRGGCGFAGGLVPLVVLPLAFRVVRGWWGGRGGVAVVGGGVGGFSVLGGGFLFWGGVWGWGGGCLGWRRVPVQPPP